jgi:hypothetical protein
LFIQQQEVVESQQIQPTGEQLSVNVLVKLGGIMFVNTVPCIFTMFIPASFFFIIKVYFPNLDWVGHENFFVRLDGL